jgi:hypothetical protein
LGLAQELEVLGELAKAQVGFVHDLGFEGSVLADFHDFRHDYEFVSAFGEAVDE